MKFEFSKYSGCGNDFIIIDNRSQFFPLNQPHLIQKLCVRRTGIGADGVILLEESEHSDFRMRIFNADGFEAEMCGNGLRCLMKFIHEKGFPTQECTIETFHRPLTVSMHQGLVTIKMGDPFDLAWNIPLEIEGQPYLVHHINTGVPHLILFTDNAEVFPLKKLGPQFRYHPQFAPQGANFNVVHLKPNGELENRTYERGVEDETLACGTGCVAVAIAAVKIYGLAAPIKVRTLSKELLEIHFTEQNGKIQNLTMSGSASKVFSGVMRMEN